MGSRLRSLVRARSAYFVGAVCVVERDDGAILLVRQSYRREWGLPGGLLKRGELPLEAMVRELREELGIHVELGDHPGVVVDPSSRRVDVIFSGRLAPGTLDVDPRGRSPEIVRAEWFHWSDLPPLQPEARSDLAEFRRSAVTES